MDRGPTDIAQTRQASAASRHAMMRRRHDHVDDLGELVFGICRARSPRLVGAGQLRDVRNAAIEADIDARRLLGDQLRLGRRRVTAMNAEQLRLRRRHAGEPEAILGVEPARDEDRLGHVERDEGQP